MVLVSLCGGGLGCLPEFTTCRRNIPLRALVRFGYNGVAPGPVTVHSYIVLRQEERFTSISQTPLLVLGKLEDGLHSVDDQKKTC